MRQSNNLLIPRRIEERQQHLKNITNRYIQKYIKNGCKGDLDLSSMRTWFDKLPDNLERIGGDFRSPLIGNIWHVDATKMFPNRVFNLNNLKHIEGSCIIYSNVNLSKLEYVGGKLDLAWINKIKMSPHLKYVWYCELLGAGTVKFPKDMAIGIER